MTQSHIRSSASATAVSVQNIWFSYGKDAAARPQFMLKDVSFEVSEGEFLSILGPNGAGKSTLLRIIDRIFLPQQGTVHIAGRNYTSIPRRELAQRIAFVPQEHAMAFPFTVREIVTMGRSPHLRGIGFEGKRDLEIAEEVMSLTDVTHLAEQPITHLSGGERQRVFIARALAQEPSILLLDEPNAHLDITHQLDILHLTRALNKERGVTVIAVFHDVNLAALFSRTILLLAAGSVVALGTPGDVLTQNYLSTVFRAKVSVDRHPFADVPRVTIIPSMDLPLASAQITSRIGSDDERH